MKPNNLKELEKFRKEYDNINNQILEAIKKRVELSKTVGKFKKINNMKIIDLKREEQMLDGLCKKAENLNLDKKFIKDIFTLIIKNSREIQ
jgi:chorismate mutase